MRTGEEGIVELRRGGTLLRARGAVAAWATHVVERGGTLHGAAAELGSPTRMEGRLPVWSVTVAGQAAVVRHYHRGGFVASLLGDRYLRTGAYRPFREMEVSDAARERGVPTPRVLAAAVYLSGIVYRGDLVTELVPASRDLAEVVFDPERRDLGAAVDRREAMAEAGRLVRTLAAAGVRHPDLNAKNVLLSWAGGAPDGVVLDLDRARVGEAPDPGGRAVMHRRLVRSLRKLGRRTGLDLPEGDLRVLERSVEGRG